MASPIVESSNGRFFVLLALGVGAVIAWYAFKGAFSIDISTIDPTIIILPIVIGSMIIRGLMLVMNHPPVELVENRAGDRRTTDHEAKRRAPQPDKPTQWNDLPERERIQILSWIAIFLGFFFYPIGSIIGLIMIRKFSGSTIVTVARVLLILSLVIPLFFIIPILMVALNPST